MCLQFRTKAIITFYILETLQNMVQNQGPSMTSLFFVASSTKIN
uniref:Uncharacterized protein n=1 Tax=Rhizophora mucronata TaxID=61149 RepID=A0A2P2QZN5_RHIMU